MGTQALVDSYKKELLDLTTGVAKNVKRMGDINRELDKIALNKQPFSDTSFFDQLIAEERMNKTDGYLKRIDSYTQFKNRINLLQKAADGNFDLSNFVTLTQQEMDALDLPKLKQATDPVEKEKMIKKGECALM